MHLMEQRDIILNGTQALGPIAVGLTHEAAEEILRVVRVGISAKATWGMVAMRALQRARQVVSCLVVAPACRRVVDLHARGLELKLRSDAVAIVCATADECATCARVADPRQ